jgi:heavy metal translocating P-type ATPase
MSDTQQMTMPIDSAGRADTANGRWWNRVDRGDLARTVSVAVSAGIVAALESADAPRTLVAAVTVAVLLAGCWPILTEAWGDVRARRMSMELSMLIAIAAAASIGQWVTALVITAFVLAAEILEDLTVDRGRGALSDLMAFLPAAVRIRDGGEVRTVPLADLAAGQVVVVSPGGAVPVDGTVISGASSLDQSRITGESMPVDVASGASVFAGSVNQMGAIEVRAERVGVDSSYGQIIETVREAQASSAPAQRLADRLAAWIVYVALAAAAVTFLLTRNLHSTISVVVVAGACGVAAGTPLAVLAAIGRAARTGAYIKAGTHLERLSTIDTVMFDKTGTLTTGAPAVIDVRPATGVTTERLLSFAAAAEAYSEHPLGQAIVMDARERGLPAQPADDFSYTPGRGVSATVGGHAVAAGDRVLVPDAPDTVTGRDAATAVHIGLDGVYAGTILLADTIRDSARQAVAELHRAGLRTVMLTGDQRAPARAVAAELGIDDVRAGLLPDEKLAAIDAQRAAGRRIAMVGDGVNDAPALARADVGIAIGTGTNIARETADIVLVSTDLGDLARTVHIARRARRIVIANFIGTIAVDLAGMTLAALGVLGPVLAAIVHVGSESAFILNSARLIPVRDPAHSRSRSATT